MALLTTGDDPVEALVAESKSEFESAGRQLKEIGLLIDQSRVEVDKLAQRNALVTGQLRQLQLNFDTVPRNDIRTAYEAAQDAQQRLYTMRGQLEKLQSEQAGLERYVAQLKKILQVLEGAEGVAAAAPAQDGGQASAVVRIVEAQEGERQRLARQMHDGPAQALSNFILQTEIAMRLFDIDVERAKAELANLKASATTTFQRVRDFIFDLRPMQLDDLGLVPTVRRYVDVFKDKSGILASFQFTGSERRMEGYREVTMFRAVQELLSAIRDRGSVSQVKVLLDLDERRVRVVVEDDGKGETPSAGAQSPSLSLLQERIGLMGGTFNKDSLPADEGSRVTLEIPAGSLG